MSLFLSCNRRDNLMFNNYLGVDFSCKKYNSYDIKPLKSIVNKIFFRMKLLLVNLYQEIRYKNTMLPIEAVSTSDRW